MFGYLNLYRSEVHFFQYYFDGINRIRRIRITVYDNISARREIIRIRFWFRLLFSFVAIRIWLFTSTSKLNVIVVTSHVHFYRINFEIIFFYKFLQLKMISTNFGKSIDKAWCLSCDEGQSKPYLIFLYDEIITKRERYNHMEIHFNNRNQNLICRMCKINKHILH